MSVQSPIIEVDGAQWPASAVINALTPLLSDSRRARLDTVLAQRLCSVALGVEDLYRNHNGSACLRTAEGLGLMDIVAAELRNAFPIGDDGYHNRHVTAHAHNWIELHRVDTGAALIDWASQREMRIFGAGPRGTLTLEQLPVDRPLVVLFGNEAEGLQEETMAACDGVFRIPMYGFTESFNVSVSVGMALQSVATRRRAHIGQMGDMPDARRQRLLAEWMAASVRNPGAVLRRYAQ
ncbi:MAG: tRNA (guanosine-2'-O-)-methyltransferase [Bradymonadia bacterium]